MNENEENPSPSLLRLKTTELEHKLLVEKQRFILLQSELESSKLIASKHVDLYKDECMGLKQKLSELENENSLLKEKEQKNQETIKNLLRKNKRFGEECGYETQKECENSSRIGNEITEEEVHNDAMKNERQKKQIFVNLDGDSDYGKEHSWVVNSEDSLIMINTECKTPKKMVMVKSSSVSICSSTMDVLCDTEVSKKSLHTVTQSAGNSNKASKRSRYNGRFPSSEQKHHALDRAEQLQKSIRNPSCVRAMPLSGNHWFALNRKFCMDNHLPDHDTEMMLECKDGAKYEVNYIGRRYAFSGGMPRFARALRLEVGDVLVFELISSTRFKVHIVKAIQEVQVLE